MEVEYLLHGVIESVLGHSSQILMWIQTNQAFSEIIFSTFYNNYKERNESGKYGKISHLSSDP